MRAIIATGLLTLPVTALAINTEPAGYYASVGVSQIDYSGKTHASLREKPDWTALEFAGGYKHSPFVGVESRLGLGGSPELLYGGVYYRTESANETAKTYLLLGVAGANIKGVSGSDVSLAGPSYGAGVGFPVGKNSNFNIEYRVLVDDSDENVNLNAITASWDYRFSEGGFATQSNFIEGQGFYLGLGLAKIDLKLDESTDEEEVDEEEVDEEENDGEPDLSWNAIELIGGYSHNPLATVELRLGTTDNAGAEGVDLSLNYISAYYRPILNLGKVDLYGLLGYSSVRWTFEDESYEYDGEVYEGEKESETFSGISLGAGVNATVTEQITVGLEYRLLAREELEGEGYKDTWDYTALSANVHYRF